MPIYNLIEYSKRYKKTTGSLWNYYRDESNNPPNDNFNADPITNSASFKYKRIITLDMPLINCEINIVLTWFENCILTDKTTQTEVSAQKDNPATNEPTNATLKITDTNLYAPVITLSIQDYKKLIDQLKTGFGRTIKWNKYRS